MTPTSQSWRAYRPASEVATPAPSTGERRLILSYINALLVQADAADE
jgi:hypothetical protein